MILLLGSCFKLLVRVDTMRDRKKELLQFMHTI